MIAVVAARGVAGAQHLALDLDSSVTASITRSAPATACAIESAA